MKSNCFASLLLPALILAGCVLPLPEFKRERYGQPIKRDKLSFIQTGRTTRPEVTARLGQPHTTLPDKQVAAYSWEGGGTVAGFFGIIHPVVGAVGEAKRWGGWHAVFIAYDAQGIVRRFGSVSLAQDRSIHEQMHDWFARTAGR